MIKIANTEIDLKLTLKDSAQSFLWKEENGIFSAALQGREVRLSMVSGILTAAGIEEAALRDYLDLNRDYAALREAYRAFPILAEAMDRMRGLRVLHQDPWDTVVCFILSANNNVGRIRSLVQKLCETYGEACGTVKGLPSPQVLSGVSESSLRALGVGYRAPYLIRTAKAIADGFPLEALSEMPYEQAHERLLTLSGVGDKVADCILLFGLRHAEAFPVDVWVERAMQRYFALTAPNRKKLAEASRALLGEQAGLAQQFLFHAARTGVL